MSAPSESAQSSPVPQGPGRRALGWADRHRTPLTIGLCLLVLFAFTFGPVLPKLGSHFLGLEYVDHYGTQWFYWWISTTVAEGSLPDHSDLFFYPWGKDIFGHTGSNVLDAYAAVPFLWGFGQILGYNLFVLTGMVVSAAAFWVLARDFTSDRLALGVGTVLFAFTPYILWEAREGRPTQALLLLPVLYVLMVWRTGARRGWVSPLLAGGMLALVGYQYWYYAFYGGVLALGMGTWRILRPPEEAGGRLRVALRYALVAAVALALTLPVALRLVSGEEVPGLLDTANWSLYSSTPITVEGTTVGLFSWQPLRRTTGFLTESPDGLEHFLIRSAWIPLAAWVPLVLWLRRPERLHRGPVLLALALLTLLSMGPLVLVAKTALPNVAYIALVQHLPFLQRLWWPARAFGFIAVLVALAITVGLAAARRWGRWLQAGLALAVAVGWQVELSSTHLPLAPFPAWDGTVPAGYRCLATGPPGALLEVPFGWTQGHLYYQTAHGRPIFGGMIENNPVFTPDALDEIRSDNTFVSRLVELAVLHEVPEEWDLADKQQMYDLGYRYVVLQKDAFDPNLGRKGMRDNVARTRFRHTYKEIVRMCGPAVYEDARIAIFSPWGEPAPCVREEIGPDTELLGLTEVSPDAMVKLSPEAQEFHRLLSGPEEEAEEDDASEASQTLEEEEVLQEEDQDPPVPPR